MSSTVTVPKATVSKKRLSSEEKEREIIARYKKKDLWYGFPKLYWLGGGLVLSLLLCMYLASKLYGQNNSRVDNRPQQSPEMPQLDQAYPPMPTGGEPYSPQTQTPQQSVPNAVPHPISSNAENMLRRDLLNRIPVSEDHLIQFESKYTQTPQQSPIEKPKTPEIQQPQSKPEDKSELVADTRTKEYYPNNKEGGGEGVPLPPANYEQLSQYDDVF